MRQPTTAEVRFDEHKAASFGPVGPSILPFWLSTSRLRSNFVAAAPPATEDQVQQAGNPENVGSRMRTQILTIRQRPHVTFEQVFIKQRHCGSPLTV
jgi:hypothetical protein